MDIFVVVGSESGNADMVADCVKDALAAMGHEAELFRGGTLADAKLAERPVVLVICSSTGLGDLPQNIDAFFHEVSGARPDLSKVRYGMVGLGDRNYRDSFLGGPKKWDALLTELGAQRVGNFLELDATDNPAPDDDAVAWVKNEWVPTL